MPTLALDMSDRREIFALPPRVAEALTAALPPGWRLLVAHEAADGSADGRPRVPPSVRAVVDDLEVYLGFGIPAELIRSAPRLAWVHSGAAGVGSSLTPDLVASPVVFTSSAGVHAVPMAETALAMILHFGRGLDLAVRQQARGHWDAEPWYRADAPVRELAGSTVGIVGLGAVGRAVGRRVALLGAEVLGLRRRRPATPEEELRHEAQRLEARAEKVVFGAEGLDELLARSDVLVMCTPATRETDHLLGAGELERLREGCLLVNLARGSVVDEDALLLALTSGRLRGAALDVAAVEPLPVDHPLWALDNVLITPHVSAVTRGFWDRETALVLHNLTAYLAGSPGRMRNVVDRASGY